jgi:hypothetical protein
MSRAGEVWDNSAMESFFSSLKTEKTSRKVYRTRTQARADVFDYIERFYNPVRRHSTLGYVSPLEFEKAQKSLGGVYGTGSSPSPYRPAETKIAEKIQICRAARGAEPIKSQQRRVDGCAHQQRHDFGPPMLKPTFSPNF